MKKKILIGSVFAALLLLSMPFMSTLQAAPAPLVESDKISIVERTSVVKRTSIVERKDNDYGLGFISVCVMMQTPTQLMGVSGIRVTLRDNNQVVRTGRTNIAGTENFFGLPKSNSYTVVFTITKGSTSPIHVDWNSGNFFRYENLDFSEDTSIKSLYNSMLTREQNIEHRDVM